MHVYNLFAMGLYIHELLDNLAPSCPSFPSMGLHCRPIVDRSFLAITTLEENNPYLLAFPEL